MRLSGTTCFAIGIFFMVWSGVQSFAQENLDTAVVVPEYWTTGGNIGVTFNQVALSNWAGGGESTFAVGSLLAISRNYDKGHSHWENTLGAAYGFTKVGDLDFRKSDDKLTFVSQYNHNATTTLLYSALLDFRTQFTEGLDLENLDSAGDPRRISTFMAPGYLNLGLGGTWKPKKFMEILVAPLSNRLIFVLDDELSAAGAFGVDPGEKIQSELGALSRIQFKNEIMENVTLGSNLSLFAPYEDMTTVVVNWESLLAMKVNDYITTSISLNVIYDEEVDVTRDDGTVGPVTQIKEALNIGFGYKL